MTDHPTPPTGPAEAGPTNGKPDRSHDREILQTFVGVYCEKKHGRAVALGPDVGAPEPRHSPEVQPGRHSGSGEGAQQGSPEHLCPDCAGLLAYALERVEKCPFDPKPACRNCKVHCYAEPFRSRIKEVMKTAGMHFVMRGRLDWLWKYFRGT